MSDGTPAPDDALAVEAHSEAEPFRFVHSPSFPALLHSLGASLLASTYQAGKLAAFRARGDSLSLLVRTFDKVMGVAVESRRMAVATNWQVWMLHDSPEVGARLDPPGTHDACYLPRSCHVTGSVDLHELAFAGGELWVVNTLFSCLATLDPKYSFEPRWRPPFVTRLARQDRCHLNGLAIVNGRPKYVTVFAQTDMPEGWREHKNGGGCLIDVESGEPVACGLSMPHSPRVYQGRLFVLDSGLGRLVTVDPQSGGVETVAQFPGYTRGLAFLGRYAFVGLSQVRETKVFGGVPIAENPAERKCGVWAVDLGTGQVVAFVEFQGDVTEVFDVQLLPGIRNPAIVGLQKETIRQACVIGPERPI